MEKRQREYDQVSSLLNNGKQTDLQACALFDT